MSSAATMWRVVRAIPDELDAAPLGHATRATLLATLRQRLAALLAALAATLHSNGAEASPVDALPAVAAWLAAGIASPR
jgi:hypothetical protein